MMKISQQIVSPPTEYFECENSISGDFFIFCLGLVLHVLLFVVKKVS